MVMSELGVFFLRALKNIFLWPCFVNSNGRYIYFEKNLQCTELLAQNLKNKNKTISETIGLDDNMQLDQKRLSQLYITYFETRSYPKRSKLIKLTMLITK